MGQARMEVGGDLKALRKQVDVGAEYTPKRVAAGNLEDAKANVKAVIQDGEKHSLTGHTSVAQANYARALGLAMTRFVSCSTTGTVRAPGALKDAGLFMRSCGVLFRRAADPWESDDSGEMNTVVPEQTIPSHQGPDAQSIIPDLDEATLAVVTAHTHSHLDAWTVGLTRPAGMEEGLAAVWAAPRIAFPCGADGRFGSTPRSI